MGRFEIISLSGSFLLTDSDGYPSSRSSGLSVFLAGSDGRVFGGGVAESLVAATSVQIPNISSITVEMALQLLCYPITLVCYIYTIYLLGQTCKTKKFRVKWANVSKVGELVKHSAY
ncbi:putative AT-hook motif nuclear-localized protein [Helianthus anomalus]